MDGQALPMEPEPPLPAAPAAGRAGAEAAERSAEAGGAPAGAADREPLRSLREAFARLQPPSPPAAQAGAAAAAGSGASDTAEEPPAPAPGEREYRLPALPPGASLTGALEALLLAADGPLELRELCEVLDGCDWVPVRRALWELRERLRQEPAGGLELVEVAGGWRLVTRPCYAAYVERLQTIEREERLTEAQLETLAVIAYRQPVPRAEIDAIRGADSSGVLRTLMDKGLVRVTGRAEQPGRPFLYGTTGRFLERFGLKSIRDLPHPRGG
ncbi:MAG: hypothetical protein KatS3mg102_2582 [Planctomycetota bacterium]|nr:MAG: hypothetical protein KatS3mg102_2582 [Planctomycetota bacterium]